MRLLQIGLALLLATTLSAQQLTLHEPFALTNTRYGTTPGYSNTLVSNGRDFFLFWTSAAGVRVTKVVAGERRAGRFLHSFTGFAPSVVWTGSGFLVAQPTRNGIVGRLLDQNAEPLGEAFPILADASNPQLASNGRRVVMLARAYNRVLAITLTSEGKPAGPPRVLLAPDPDEVRAFDIASNGTNFEAVVATAFSVRLFLLGGDGEAVSEQRIASYAEPRLGFVTAASDGRDYLAAWSAVAEPARAVFVSASGAVGAPLAFEEPPMTGDLQAVWTGSSYAILYSVFDPVRTRIAHVDADVRRSHGKEEMPGVRQAIASAGGRTLVAFTEAESEPPIQVTALPLGESPAAEVVTYAPAEQTLRAAAASFDATLTVWTEHEDGRKSLRAGVRTRDGEWQERELLADPPTGGPLVAASNGREFVVAISTSRGPFAYFLDDRGRRIGAPVPLPLTPFSIAWNGTHYLLGGNTEAAVAALHPSGAVSGPVLYDTAGTRTVVATDGKQTIAAWMEPEPCPILCVGEFGAIVVSRLGPNLERLDPNLFTTYESVRDVAAAWDGSRFVVAWDSGAGIRYARINPTAPATPVVLALSDAAEGVEATSVTGGAAVAWMAERTQHLAVLGSRGQTQKLQLDAPGSSALHVTAAPDGAVALFSQAPRPAAPHHGSRRVLMALATPVPVGPPDPPELDANLRNGRIRLSWTAPPQAVAGYRIEYKIGDGAWNELEPWFDADTRSTLLQFTIRRNVEYLFRIRAINEAGPSAYSPVARWSTPKRRAVK